MTDVESYLATPLRCFWLAAPSQLPDDTSGGHRSNPREFRPDWQLGAALAVEVYETRLSWVREEDSPKMPAAVLERAGTPDTRELVARLLGGFVD